MSTNVYVCIDLYRILGAVDGKLILAEEEEYTVRWYHRYEMELFLEKAGFVSVQIFDESFEQNEQAVIYAASCAE